MRTEEFAYNLGYRVTRKGILLNSNGDEMSCRLDKHGYYERTLRVNSQDKKWTHLMIHRLQAYQKYGDKIYEPGIQIKHLNGNSTDNSYNNIGIGTAHDNAMDKDVAVRLSSSRMTAKSLPLRYSKEKILSIKNDRKNGLTYGEIMKKYGISSKGTVSYICKHEYIW